MKEAMDNAIWKSTYTLLEISFISNTSVSVSYIWPPCTKYIILASLLNARIILYFNLHINEQHYFKEHIFFQWIESAIWEYRTLANREN